MRGSAGFAKAAVPGELVLRHPLVPGEAWCGYRLNGAELVQVDSLRPKGIPGLLYWKALDSGGARDACGDSGRLDADLAKHAGRRDEHPAEVETRERGRRP